MHVAQRQVLLGLQIFVSLVLVAQIIGSLVVGRPIVVIVVLLLLLLGSLALLYASWRGWRYAPVSVVIVSIISSLAPPNGELHLGIAIGLLIPSLFALIFGRPNWIIMCAVLSPLVFFARSGFATFPNDPSFFIIYVLMVGGFVFARFVLDGALNDARASGQRAVEALKIAETQTQQLEAANAQQQTQLAEQQRLLDLVATLEVPAVTLDNGVLFAPVVGYLDTRRAQALTKRLLHEAHERRARLVILDITGVATADSTTAEALLDTVRALRLLGCDVTVSGISASVAQTLTVQGISLAGITTVRSPQEALARVGASN